MVLLEDGSVKVRRFAVEDVEKKVEWINNPDNNTYLHYDLPLETDKTRAWYERIKESDTRLDAVIEYDKVPVGLIGLLGIDKKSKKAEYYICMGENEYKGKGIAKKASILLLRYAFSELGLNKVYLYTEEENSGAQLLFEKLGFRKEGLLLEDMIHNGRKINRYVYGILSGEFVK